MATINMKERIVMRAVYEMVNNKDSALIEIEQIWERIRTRKYLKFLRKKTKWDNAQTGKLFVIDKPIEKNKIRDILFVLAYAEYFTITSAQNKGKEVFVIDMTEKGKNFLRDERDRRKNIILIISRTIALAVLGSLVTFILKLIIYG